MNKRGIFGSSGIRKTEQYVLALFLVLLGVAGRFALEAYPNIETVMVATFLIGVYVDRRIAFAFPLIIMALSDYFMGHQIFALSGLGTIWVFTYTGFAIIYFFSLRNRGQVKKDLKQVSAPSAVNAAGYGVVFALVYDIWTNIGAWLLMYPHTLEGLITCYVMAVPFMLYHMLSGAATFVTIALPFGALLELMKKSPQEQSVEQPRDIPELS